MIERERAIVSAAAATSGCLMLYLGLLPVGVVALAVGWKMWHYVN